MAHRSQDVPVAPASRDDSSTSAPVLSVLLLVVAGALAYSNTFTVPFQFDDGLNIVENPGVRSLGAFLSSGASARRWLGLLSFAANGSLGGLDVAGFHAVNLSIHLLAGIEVYLLTRLVLRLRAAAEPDAGAANGGAAPLVAALLFVLHPLQTQAVTYIVQRLTSLAALLFIGAVLLHGCSTVATTARRARLLYAPALASAVLSLFVKENAVTVPLAVAAFDAAFCPGGVRERIRRLLPYLLVTVAIALFLLRPSQVVATVTREFEGAAAPSELPPWLSYLATQPRVLLTYLRLVVAPYGQNLDYDFPVASALTAAPTVLSAAALLLLLGLPAAWAWRHRDRSWPARLVLFTIAWILLGLAVESSVIPLPDVINEHRMYLPMAGIAVALGLGLQWGWLERITGRGNSAIALSVVAVALAVLGAATWSRNRVWANPATLWGDVVAKSPAKSRGHVWIAKVLAARGDLGGAIAILEQARGLPTRNPHVFINLGAFYAEVGRLGEAEASYRHALSMPGGAMAETHLGLGQLLLDEGQPGAACRHFQDAVDIKPSSTLARANSAACRQRAGDLKGAARDWQLLLRDDPFNLPAMFNLAGALAELGNRGAAAETYRRFLSLADATYAPQRAHAERWLTFHAGSPAHGDPGPAP